MQNTMIFGELSILNPPKDQTPESILSQLKQIADDVELVRKSHKNSPIDLSTKGLQITCNSEFSYEKLLREEIFIGEQQLIIKEIEGRCAYDVPYLVGADRRIYLKRVPARVKERDLVKYFSKYGEVQLALILKYKEDPQIKNSGEMVGHIFFDEPESVQKAAQVTNICIRGCKLYYSPFELYLSGRR